MQTTHQRPNQTQKPSCDSLGTCQCRLPACSGCTWVTDAAARVAGHAFAPGVITGHIHPRKVRVRRWVRLALVAAVGLVVVAMGAGYLVGTFMSGV